MVDAVSDEVSVVVVRLVWSEDGSEDVNGAIPESRLLLRKKHIRMEI